MHLYPVLNEQIWLKVLHCSFLSSLKVMSQVSLLDLGKVVLNHSCCSCSYLYPLILEGEINSYFLNAPTLSYFSRCLLYLVFSCSWNKTKRSILVIFAQTAEKITVCLAFWICKIWLNSKWSTPGHMPVGVLRRRM